jgi:hypothetical protein
MASALRSARTLVSCLGNPVPDPLGGITKAGTRIRHIADVSNEHTLTNEQRSDTLREELVDVEWGDRLTAAERSAYGGHGLTAEEFREQLRNIDFSDVRAGDTIQLFDSVAPDPDPGLLELTVPGRRECVLEAIVDKLFERLSPDVADDVSVFYSLVAARAHDYTREQRALLVRKFEHAEFVAALPLLRIGNGYDPVVDALHWSSEHDGHVNFELRWTN